MLKLAFVIRTDGFILAKLTRIFTGCYCYHVGFIDVETETFYDIALFGKRGRRDIFRKYKRENVVVVDCPVEVTINDIEDDIIFNKEFYGLLDYFMFALREPAKMFGRVVPNMKGVICSEWVNDVLVKKGWGTSPFIDKPIPSPCDLLRHFTDLGD